MAFVHVGPVVEATIRYCFPPTTSESTATTPPWTRTDSRAIAVTDEDVLVCEPRDDTHPAERLASRLADRGLSGTVLTPPTIPHDAAIYLDRAGFVLASSDAVAHARARKTAAERARLVDAQRTGGDGIRRAATILADADIVDGRLVVDGGPLTPDRLRRELDSTIVAAGGLPAGTTSVRSPRGSDEPLRPGEPIVLSTAPRGPAGYHGRLVRTLVVESDGGWERRAHVAIESAFRSVVTMLGADDSTVGAVEAELVAEVRSFGFAEEVTATVSGVGLEPGERPSAPIDPIDDGTVVGVEAAIGTEDGTGEIRLCDLLERRDGDADWLSVPSRSLDPETVASETTSIGP